MGDENYKMIFGTKMPDGRVIPEGQFSFRMPEGTKMAKIHEPDVLKAHVQIKSVSIDFVCPNCTANQRYSTDVREDDFDDLVRRCLHCDKDLHFSVTGFAPNCLTNYPDLTNDQAGEDATYQPMSEFGIMAEGLVEVAKQRQAQKPPADSETLMAAIRELRERVSRLERDS